MVYCTLKQSQQGSTLLTLIIVIAMMGLLVMSLMQSAVMESKRFSLLQQASHDEQLLASMQNKALLQLTTHCLHQSAQYCWGSASKQQFQHHDRQLFFYIKSELTDNNKKASVLFARVLCDPICAKPEVMARYLMQENN